MGDPGRQNQVVPDTGEGRMPSQVSRSVAGTSKRGLRHLPRLHDRVSSIRSKTFQGGGQTYAAARAHKGQITPFREAASRQPLPRTAAKGDFGVTQG